MAGRLKFLAFAFAAQLPVAAQAQPVDIPIPAATTTEFPTGITVARVKGGQVYVDAHGRTLYGMDMRMVARWSVDTSKYCKDRCAEWEPVLAPADAKPNLTLSRGFRGGDSPRPVAASGAAANPAAGAGRPVAAGASPAAPPRGPLNGTYTQQNAPDWTIVEGPAGPQYVYQGYNMVYVRKGDKPRSTEFEGADGQIWNTLKFVPPVPELTAPGGVKPSFVDGAYALADKDGNLLYSGRCGKDCAGWKPLAGGLASQGMGEWTVDRTADRPQWLYRGKPVFVAGDDQLASLPRAAAVLRP